MHTLIALRGRPNRSLPIGVHEVGPLTGEPHFKHVRTGSTRQIDDADVSVLQAYIDEKGLGDSYRLTALVPPNRQRRGPKGTRALPGTKARAAKAAAEAKGSKARRGQ